jgi:hypothetical protein
MNALGHTSDESISYISHGKLFIAFHQHRGDSRRKSWHSRLIELKLQIAPTLAPFLKPTRVLQIDADVLVFNQSLGSLFVASERISFELGDDHLGRSALLAATSNVHLSAVPATTRHQFVLREIELFYYWQGIEKKSEIIKHNNV